LERGHRDPENPQILLIIREKFQNNKQFLFEQEIMMIKNRGSQNKAIINMNKEERKSIFDYC